MDRVPELMLGERDSLKDLAGAVPREAASPSLSLSRSR